MTSKYFDQIEVSWKVKLHVWWTLKRMDLAGIYIFGNLDSKGNSMYKAKRPLLANILFLTTKYK